MWGIARWLLGFDSCPAAFLLLQLHCDFVQQTLAASGENTKLRNSSHRPKLGLSSPRISSSHASSPDVYTQDRQTTIVSKRRPSTSLDARFWQSLGIDRGVCLPATEGWVSKRRGVVACAFSMLTCRRRAGWPGCSTGVLYWGNMGMEDSWGTKAGGFP